MTDQKAQSEVTKPRFIFEYGVVLVLIVGTIFLFIYRYWWFGGIILFIAAAILLLINTDFYYKRRIAQSMIMYDKDNELNQIAEENLRQATRNAQIKRME